MKVETAKELIKVYEKFVQAYEGYEPQTMEQHAIKLYAEHENVSKVAALLNDMGYSKPGRLVAGKRGEVKLQSNDVTKMIDSDVDPDDELHPMVKKSLNGNRRRKGIVV